jgi:hypothetical protein
MSGQAGVVVGFLDEVLGRRALVVEPARLAEIVGGHALAVDDLRRWILVLEEIPVARRSSSSIEFAIGAWRLLPAIVWEVDRRRALSSVAALDPALRFGLELDRD